MHCALAGVGNAPDTYALSCQPQDKQQQQQRLLPLVKLEDSCYNYTVNTSRTPDLSAVAATLNLDIVQLVRDNLNTSAAPLVQMSLTLNWTEAPAASSNDDDSYDCSSQPDCTPDTLVGGCLLSVVNASDSASCNMTWLQPNLSVPLTDGMALKVCKIPAITWTGRDLGMSGSAAAGELVFR